MSCRSIGRKSIQTIYSFEKDRLFERHEGVYVMRQDVEPCGVVIYALARFLQNALRPCVGVLQVRSCVSFETQRLLDIKRDYLVQVLLDHVVSYGRDRNLFRNAVQLMLCKVGVSCLDLLVRLSMQRVEDIVGIDIDALSARHVHELPVAYVDPKRLGSLGAERNGLVSEVVVLSAACAYLREYLRYYPLQARLSRIDYCYHPLAPIKFFVYLAAAVAVAAAAVKRCCVEGRAVPLVHEFAVRERVVDESELPGGIGDILCDVGGRAVAPHYNLVFLVLGLNHPAAFVLAFRLEPGNAILL